MEYEEIVAVVRQASGGIGSEAADRALQATLQELHRIGSMVIAPSVTPAA